MLLSTTACPSMVDTRDILVCTIDIVSVTPVISALPAIANAKLLCCIA